MQSMPKRPRETPFAWQFLFSALAPLLSLNEWTTLQKVNTVCRKACRDPNAIRGMRFVVRDYARDINDVAFGISHVSDIRHLEMNVPMKDSHLKTILPRLSKLKTFDVTGCTFHASTLLQLLLRASDLKELRLAQCVIYGGDIRPNEVIQTGITHFAVSSSTDMPPEFFKLLLSSLSNLKTLSVWMCSNLLRDCVLTYVPEGVTSIEMGFMELRQDDVHRLEQRLPNLQKLDVSGNRQLSKEYIEILRTKYVCEYFFFPTKCV